MSNSSAIFEATSYPKATCVFSKQHHSTLHLHRHLEFICLYKGEIEFTISGKKYILSNGDSAIIMPYTPHSYHPLTDDCERFVLVFEPEYIGSLGDILLENHPTNPIISAEVIKREFSPLIDTFLDIAHNIQNAENDNLAYVQAYSKIVSFIAKLLSITALSKNSVMKNKLYLQIISYCNTKFCDPEFDIHAVAQKYYICTSRIQQLFNENVNISFKKYITLLRISKAKSLLRETSMSIAEIAAASGFNSTRTFNRIFKQHKNLTPFEYRKATK